MIAAVRNAVGHASETQGRDLQAGIAEISVLHISINKSICYQHIITSIPQNVSAETSTHAAISTAQMQCPPGRARAPSIALDLPSSGRRAANSARPSRVGGGQHALDAPERILEHLHAGGERDTHVPG